MVHQQQTQQQVGNETKKERISKNKDKREKATDEEKELRKERKLGRKRVNIKHIVFCRIVILIQQYESFTFRIAMMLYWLRKDGKMTKKWLKCCIKMGMKNCHSRIERSIIT